MLEVKRRVSWRRPSEFFIPLASEQCLVQAHEPRWSDWSTFGALTRIIQNEKQTLFRLVVCGWGLSLGLSAAVLPLE